MEAKNDKKLNRRYAFMIAQSNVWRMEACFRSHERNVNRSVQKRVPCEQARCLSTAAATPATVGDLAIQHRAEACRVWTACIASTGKRVKPQPTMRGMYRRAHAGLQSHQDLKSKSQGGGGAHSCRYTSAMHQNRLTRCPRPATHWLLGGVSASERRAPYSGSA
jgi:hypothetical protein